jgi:sulfate transport system ATP-binding protein
VSIAVRQITKTFGSFVALKDVSLEVPSGELVALLGPSGSGKTTLLRIIAGLESPDRGAVLFDGEDATERHVRERRVGFVFQHYALFRHLTVFENVAFGLRVMPRAVRPSEQQIRQRVADLLDLVQLRWLADRYPDQLSGGQRQRVALVRALAIEPRVLLLDEPFGALDARVRKELRRWLRRLHDDLRVTSVFVTHDQEEALELADRVVVMNAGQIEQIGTPEEVYDHPASPFVYEFLGGVNRFLGRVGRGQAEFGPLAVSAPSAAAPAGAPAVGYVRPHDLELLRAPDGSATVAARVEAVHAAGPLVRLDLRRCDSGDRLEAELSRERFRALALQVGEVVHVVPRNLRVFVQPLPSAD